MPLTFQLVKNNQMYNYKDELPVYDYQNIQHIFKDNIFKKKEKHIQKENKIYSYKNFFSNFFSNIFFQYQNNSPLIKQLYSVSPYNLLHCKVNCMVYLLKMDFLVLFTWHCLNFVIKMSSKKCLLQGSIKRAGTLF